MNTKSELMNAADMQRALKRISHQILERNHGAENLVLLGIRRRGVPLARVLAENIKAIEKWVKNGGWLLIGTTLLFLNSSSAS